MNDTKVNEILKKLSRKEKARLVTGKNYWVSQDLPLLGLKGMVMSDGPHGLRKQGEEADYTGLNPSFPAVCFPSASLTACSFDPELLYEMGKALGKEASSQDIDVLLGPGINIKRTPWGGRNFEYFSEDPYLTGVLAAAYVKGVQSQNVMCALKHFACNNQENYRMTQDSIVSLKTLAELYTPAFKYVIEQAPPEMLMTSYNKINGVYASENKGLMDLAKSWGFNGIMVTDWGSLNDPKLSLKNGTDLEMPGLSKGLDQIAEETLDDQRLDDIAGHIISGMLYAKQRKPADPEKTIEENLALSRKIAEESAVLLKNENSFLPFNPSKKIALIGSMAKEPRYQGSGSSKVNPVHVESLYDVLKEQGADFIYSTGISPDGSTNEELIKEAEKAASSCDFVLIAAGLPEIYESEGYDRKDLKLPSGTNCLIERISKKYPTAVLLQCGSPAELPWIESVQAVLLMYLSGGMGASAAWNLLCGKKNPAGKLAETWPCSIDDVPVQAEDKNVHYQEGIFSGYRYYSSQNIPVLFPFGYGLNYSRFQIENCQLVPKGEEWIVSASLKNRSIHQGSQVIQIYIEYEENGRKVRKLKGFKKVKLDPDQEKEVSIVLNLSDFAVFDEQSLCWKVKPQTYSILAGFDSQEFFFRSETAFDQEIRLDLLQQEKLAWKQLEKDWEKTFEEKPAGKKEIDQNTTIEELCKRNRFYRFIFSWIIRSVTGKEKSETGKKILEATILQMPVRLIGMYGLSKKQVNAAVSLLNGRLILAVRDLL